MDEDLRRREHILNIILIGSIVMLTILDSTVLFYSLREGSRYKEMSFAIFSLLPLFFIFLYALSRRGHSVIASYLLIGGYFLSNSYAAYRWGVTLQVVILAYALIIIMATILRGTKFGFVTTAAIATLIIPLWYAQFNGIIVTQKQQLRGADGLIFSVLYFLIMIVAWLYNREIEKSLSRARRSEKELKEQRDLLEITVEERTEELRRTQFEKIEQLNRFAELGQLSSGLFHDVFNLLSAVSLREENSSENSLAEAFVTTKQIDNFAQALRKQLNHHDSQELFSLNQSIDHVIQLLAYKANKEHIRITVENNGPQDIKYFDSPFKFHQIILNLLLNAIESFEGLHKIDETAKEITLTIQEKNKIVTIHVADNGSGISPEVLPKIFDQFFTTKGTSKGIGIGLSTIKKIIEEELNGTITVKSEVNKGSRFTITFPLTYAPLPKDHPESTRADQKGPIA
jgi:signal transduction histidine kinase